MPEVLLETRELTSGYGKAVICSDVSLKVAAGEITCIIGPNGAGKSTLLKTIAGVLPPIDGQIEVAGRNVTGQSAAEVARSGMAYVPQEANVFRQMTTHENLAMGGWIDEQRTNAARDEVYEMFPDLVPLKHVRAGDLSGGQRQMVAFGMALMLSPRILLLDEPSAGLSPLMVGQMFDTVVRVNGQGVAILMVEQNAIQGLKISHRGIVMAGGQIAMEGAASDLLESKSVSELYLGSRT
ncbi:MAG: ABC transporter ATP-binding protein [Rhizobiaceae bacterium]|jgi:branched-chain amino acid transport system ATP-binding protein/neutral amino acid transport system ATP-binding protein|nr:ABC transporter ATP-binding protein [Rhizobiaceae bacterium]